MSALLTVLPLLLSIGLMVAVAKLAAWLYRRSYLSWGRATGYVFLVVIGVVALSLLNKLGGSSTPLPVLVIVSLAFHGLLGGWYFGTYVRTAAGSKLAFPRGAILAGIYFALLLLILAVPAGVLLALRP